MIKLIGVSYEGKQNFLKGTRIAPSFIRWAYESIEDYSPYMKQKLSSDDFLDLGDFHASWEWAPLEFVERYHNFAGKLISKEDLVVFLGGDHFTTYANVHLLRKLGKEFVVFQLDAHLDRRDVFEGERFNHATFVRRLEEEGFEVFTFGFRSFAKDLEYTNERTYPFKVLENVRCIWDSISKDVYLSIDVDVLDPSVFPSVTNPEPNGIHLDELLYTIGLIKDKLIAVDIVEFSPIVGDAYRSGVCASTLLRESLIALKYRAHKRS